jgi:hypothetical protein
VEGGEVMRMAKKKNQGWPETLYMTPDKWSFFGDIFVVDQKGLCRMICDLRSLGEDWSKISMDDARPIRLVRVDDDDRAVYEGWSELHREKKLYRVRRHRFPDGEVRYDWCELDLCREEEGE